MTLPAGWGSVALAELANDAPYSLAIGPFGSSLKVPDYRENGVPLVFVREIRRELFGGTGSKFVEPGKAEELRAHAVRGGDLLITKMGEPPGDTAIYPASRPPGVITADCIKLTPDSRVTSAEFLRYALRGPEAKASLLEETQGVAQQKLSLERFRGIEISLPPLPEQRRIVAKLDALLARSRKAKDSFDRLPAMLEKLRQSVLAAAFRGDLSKEWREAHPDVEPAEKLLERIRVERRRRWEDGLRAKGKDPRKATYEEPASVETAGLPELPEGWAWASVEALGEVRLGRQRSPTNVDGPHQTPYLRAANVTWDGLALDDVKSMNFPPHELQSYRLRPGDLLLSEASGSATEVGKPAIWRDEIPGACFQNTLIRVRPYLPMSEFLYTRFLFDALSGAFVRDSQGIGIQHLGAEKLAALVVPVPPTMEQERILSAVSGALSHLERVARIHAQQIARLASLDQSLLARAFRGELVPQDPSDEPASVLLDRIRAERVAAAVTKPRRGRKASVALVAAAKKHR